MKMINAIIILSGGMDSVTLLHYLTKIKKIKPAIITFNYGQKHSKEINYAKENAIILGCKEHIIIDMSFLKPLFANSALISKDIQVPDMIDVQGDPQPPTYVPNRNMIFLSLAAAYAETYNVTDIYYGAQKHDEYGYWDTTSKFLESLNNVYLQNRKTPVKIIAPFINFAKKDILKLGFEADVDYSLTWSCYKGEELACGSCPTCSERLKAFSELGVKDPLPYA